MADQIPDFIDGDTGIGNRVKAAWLNDVNDATYRANTGITGATPSRTLLSKLSDIISVKDFGAVGDGVTDDTAAFVLAAATGKPLYMPVGTYIISSPVTISADLSGGGSYTGKTLITLTGTGQLIVGDDRAHWSGFRIQSAVNALTFVVCNVNNWRFDHFHMIGTGTTQVGIKYDTDAGTGGRFHNSIQKFLFTGIASPVLVSGTGAFNNNKLGDFGDSWQSFTSAIRIENGAGGFQVNHVSGYFETGTNFLSITATNVRENTFDVWLDNAGWAINSSAAVGRNIWPSTPPDQYTTTGAGLIAIQYFTEKVKIRASRNADQGSVADATFTKISFDTETYDPNATFATGTFLAPRAGYYRVYAQMQMTTNLADQDSVYISLYKNGAEASRMQISISGAGGAYACIEDTFLMAKSDTVEVYARGDQAAANNQHIITGSALVTYVTVEEV